MRSIFSGGEDGEVTRGNCRSEAVTAVHSVMDVVDQSTCGLWMLSQGKEPWVMWVMK